MFLCHVDVSKQSTLFSCLNVKELVAQNRSDIWSLSDCNETRTYDFFCVVVSFCLYATYYVTSDIALVSSKEFLDIQAAIESGFTMKRVRGMMKTSTSPKLTKRFYGTFLISIIKRWYCFCESINNALMQISKSPYIFVFLSLQIGPALMWRLLYSIFSVISWNYNTNRNKM